MEKPIQLAFKHEDTAIEFVCTYSSRRKTLAIIVEPPGRVRVIAPARTTQKVIIDRVRYRAPWILRKLKEVRHISSSIIKKEFVSGESFMYLGENYPLQVEADIVLSRAAVNIFEGKFIVAAPDSDGGAIRQAMETWYRSRAAEQIKARIDCFQPRLNASPNKVTIKNQKTRWGSCSLKGNLNFNWRVVMAPAHVMDYLVVHEMCHLVEHNHSHDFWNLVASILPDYLPGKAWLKQNGLRLSL